MSLFRMGTRRAMMIRVIAVIFAWLVCSSPGTAEGWWAAGHMIVARIAFDSLPAPARENLMVILAAHPQMGEWRTHLDFAPAGQGDCFLFMRASTWPDEINKDHSNPNAHPSWHYIDYPLHPPDFPFEAGLAPRDNALYALDYNMQILRDPAAGASTRAIALSWVIHLVGDLHQPLHCAELVTGQYPSPVGDRGGNLFFVTLGGQAMNLHAFWDGLPGAAVHPDQVFTESAELERRFPPVRLPELARAKDPVAWSLESRALAIEKVYLRGALVGATDPAANPPPLPPGYVSASRAIADRQLALAGSRLGSLLREATQRTQ